MLATLGLSLTKLVLHFPGLVSLLFGAAQAG